MSAKQNNKEQSLAALGKAIAFDKKYADIASRERAFDGLRQDAGFTNLVPQQR